MTYQYQQFETALRLLNGRLAIADAPTFHLVVCGGTALVATGLVLRATRDVDIVALADEQGGLIDPAPLPAALIKAAGEVAEDLGLPKDWLNNGPSSGEGGLYRLGLPHGFAETVDLAELRRQVGGGLHQPDRPNLLQTLRGRRPVRQLPCNRSAGFGADRCRVAGRRGLVQNARSLRRLSTKPQTVFPKVRP